MDFGGPCLPSPAFAATLRQTTSEAARVERLAGLCKLWGFVKYFHPTLAHRPDIDWDAALVATIPKVQNANTSTEYGAALQQLLDQLKDPATKVLKSAPAERLNVSEQLAYRLTEDGTLVVTVGSYYQLWAPPSQQILKTLLTEIPAGT
ncbi:MAG TPA: hypothetical protein VI306_08640 [Pyrinomonadaceae bacterium]